jgi:hypothetical protein
VLISPKCCPSSLPPCACCGSSRYLSTSRIPIKTTVATIIINWLSTRLDQERAKIACGSTMTTGTIVSANVTLPILSSVGATIVRSAEFASQMPVRRYNALDRSCPEHETHQGIYHHSSYLLPPSNMMIKRTMIPSALYTTITTTLTICHTSAAILPVPKLSPISSPSTSALMTGITYHQGVVSSNNSAPFPGICNAQVVATGELTAGFCVGLHTYAVSIDRMQGLECAFKMFHGSAACEADATDTVSRDVILCGYVRPF